MLTTIAITFRHGGFGIVVCQLHLEKVRIWLLEGKIDSSPANRSFRAFALRTDALHLQRTRAGQFRNVSKWLVSMLKRVVEMNREVAQLSSLAWV